MCKLLISVRSAEEALLAQESGADFIDLKDPEQGALGALDLAVTASIIAALNEGCMISATIGDLPMIAEEIDSAIARRITLNIDYLKVGFFSASIEEYFSCLEVIKHYTKLGHKIIVVLFADIHYPDTLMNALSKANLAGLMLDTMYKNGKTLLDHYSDAEIERFIAQVRTDGRLVGLAGSLQIADVTKLKPYKPDYLGFRGGVCDASERQGALDAARIKEISKVL